MKTMKKIILVLLVLASGLMIGAYWSLQQELPLGADSITIQIPAGTTVNGAVAIFDRKGLLSWPLAARLSLQAYALSSGARLNRGQFTLQRGQSQFEALKSLFARPGKARTVNVTFPEGLSLRRVAAIVARNGLCDSSAFLRAARSDSLAQALKISAGSLEGYLMPETYNFYAKSSPQSIIKRMVEEHRRFWTEERLAQARERKLSLHEIVTLASIVEAETPQDWEKQRVSGVYHNRLERGMRLQADPTVQYALGDVQRRLLYRDLTVDNPYNTYKYGGLPPGPINSPGRAALEAALLPEEHTYYYFVATGDGSATHEFSRTELQHQRAVARYRARRRSR